MASIDLHTSDPHQVQSSENNNRPIIGKSISKMSIPMMLVNRKCPILKTPTISTEPINNQRPVHKTPTISMVPVKRQPVHKIPIMPMKPVKRQPVHKIPIIPMKPHVNRQQSILNIPTIGVNKSL